MSCTEDDAGRQQLFTVCGRRTYRFDVQAEQVLYATQQDVRAASAGSPMVLLVHRGLPYMSSGHCRMMASNEQVVSHMGHLIGLPCVVPCSQPWCRS